MIDVTVDTTSVDVVVSGFSVDTAAVADVVTVEGPPGPEGPTGPQGPVYSPPAWQQVTLTDPPSNLFGVGEVTWGSNGFGYYRWTRIGDTVLMKIYLAFDVDAVFPTPSAFIFPASVLPATPLAPVSDMSVGANFAIPGGFGYLNITPTESQDGSAHTVSAAVIQTPGPTLAFVAAPSVTTSQDGGAFTLWGEGRPATMTGRYASLQCSLSYEAEG